LVGIAVHREGTLLRRLVVRVRGPRGYARFLASLKFCEARRTLSLAADGGSLMQRIRRLLEFRLTSRESDGTKCIPDPGSDRRLRSVWA
jgi:hypothetical protein